MTGQSQFYPRLRDGQSAVSVGAVATCDRVLETATGAAPEWVHLLPLGAVEGRDGRSWSLNDAKSPARRANIIIWPIFRRARSICRSILITRWTSPFRAAPGRFRQRDGSNPSRS